LWPRGAADAIAIVVVPLVDAPPRRAPAAAAASGPRTGLQRFDFEGSRSPQQLAPLDKQLDCNKIGMPALPRCAVN
jgi:hypothetical protein